MRYDEIFEKPIEEYTDEEIRQRAISLRANARLTRSKKSTQGKEVSDKPAVKSTKKGGIEEMLEQAMVQAKKRKEQMELNLQDKEPDDESQDDQTGD